MKLENNLTTCENITNLLLDAKTPNHVHIIEQTIAHRHNEMTFEQGKLLRMVCNEKRKEFSR